MNGHVIQTVVSPPAGMPMNSADVILVAGLANLSTDVEALLTVTGATLWWQVGVDRIERVVRRLRPAIVCTTPEGWRGLAVAVAALLATAEAESPVPQTGPRAQGPAVRVAPSSRAAASAAVAVARDYASVSTQLAMIRATAGLANMRLALTTGSVPPRDADLLAGVGVVPRQGLLG